MTSTSTNPHLGSSFADFLAEEGIQAEVTAEAVKRVLAWQLGQEVAVTVTTKTADSTEEDRLVEEGCTMVERG